MGRWFPGFRTGTREQVRTFKDAHFSLFRNGRYESRLRTADGRRAIREESSRYDRLNTAAWNSARPLSRTQQWWHWHRALGAEDRDFMRLQRASERQERQRGRSR